MTRNKYLFNRSYLVERRVAIHVRSMRGMEDQNEIGAMVFEQSPVRMSKSNGATKSAIRRAQGRSRTMKSSLEDNVGIIIDHDPNIWQPVVEHCADTSIRCKVGNDGPNPYKRVKDRESTAPIAAFAEKGAPSCRQARRGYTPQK